MCIRDSVGTVLNPALLKGQIHGGVAQGVGQAVMERAGFDDIGQNSPIVVWGLRQPGWQRDSYAGRAPTDRPFFQPVSLDPRQAKLMISLAHRRSAETKTVVDPFCGTQRQAFPLRWHQEASL